MPEKTFLVNQFRSRGRRKLCFRESKFTRPVRAYSQQMTQCTFVTFCYVYNHKKV